MTEEATLPDEEVTPTPDEFEYIQSDETAESGDPAPEPEKETESAEKPREQTGKSKRHYRREISRLRRELDELKQTRQPERPIEEPQAPKRDDFDDYETYLQAHATYVARDTLKREKEQAEKAEQERKQSESRQQQQSAWEDAKEDARDRYDDFDDVLEDVDSITAPMADAMLESDIGADIAYYLGKHPDEIDRISKLSPVRQIAAIGRIESIVQAALDKPPTKPISEAPEPVKPNKGGKLADDSPHADDKVDDWMTKRRKQVYGR